MGEKRLKASFVIIKKGYEVTTILIREDKKVWFNFGSDIWIDYFKMTDESVLHKDSGKNKNYLKWINSPKFKKSHKETLEVIENNDFGGIVKKFIKDFKKDRSIIIRQDVEIDPTVKPGDIK